MRFGIGPAHGLGRGMGWGLCLLVALAVVPVAVFADGGFYTGTKHGSATSGVQRDPDLPQGSCVQCHTSHGESTQDFGLWAANDNSLCFSCHTVGNATFTGQTAYASSGHAASTASFNQRPVGQCVQCHNPHGAGDSRGVFPSMAARGEEQVCFTCHGTNIRPSGAADIQTPSSKRYSHSVTSFERLHDDAAEFGATRGNPNQNLSGSSRHVECADCHNTHVAKSARRPDRTSFIGEAMLGSWGVRPNYFGAPWIAPSSYTVERFQSTAISMESSLCFKCHSGYAYGNVPPYTADGTVQTNTAMEFSPGNPSYHNVTGQAEPLVPSEDTLFGIGGTIAYVNQWGPNSAMACTDCHASDAGAGSARGPHGSTFGMMLKKRFQGRPGAFNNTGAAGTQADLCFDCHDWNTYGLGGLGSGTNFRSGSTNLHSRIGHAKAGCFQCHSAVPHGFKRKHMIVYVSDGAPYYQSDPTNYAAVKGGIEAYGHTRGGEYTVNSCRAGCHTVHQKSQPISDEP